MTLLILSSAYVDDDMRLEFGSIPPCFLPLGNRYLLEHQVESFNNSRLILTLPKDFKISKHQANILDKLDAEIFYYEEAPVVEVLHKVLDSLDLDDVVNILFGDTLVYENSIKNDIIGLSKGFGFYSWSIYDQAKNSLCDNNFQRYDNDVFNGFFRCSSASELKKTIESSGSIISVLNACLNKYNYSLEKDLIWYDFGHINTYFNSRRSCTTERAFNQLIISNEYFIKRSENKEKLNAELNWFLKIPENLRVYTPHVFGGDGEYKIEYLNHLTLSDLYLYGRLPPVVWKKILKSCFDFLHGNRAYNDVCISNNWDHREKVRSRWADLSLSRQNLLGSIYEKHGVTIDQVLEEISEYLNADQQFCGVIHGDFCFSNVFYDFRSARIVVIDPRGSDFLGCQTIYGPIYYDVAKLAHSVIGRYDDIVSGRYEITYDKGLKSIVFFDSDLISEIQDYFSDFLNIYGFSVRKVYAEMIALFISMVPLHADDEFRQEAFILNSIRLLDTFRKL